MKRIKLEIVCFSLLILLVTGGCFVLSRYADAKIHAVKGLLDELPAGEEGAMARETAEQIEAGLKEAEKTLAYMVRYDQINRAQSAAAGFTSALAGDERSDVESARRALKEALESLLRHNEFSLEIFL